MGCDIGEDEKAIKPKAKHRIIREAYKKRKEDPIEVSIKESFPDPAGVNFDKSNFHSTESNELGLFIYMGNMVNRRNAVTSMDFQEPNVNCAQYTSSCESEFVYKAVSLSVTESRRSSVDSQVSLKMSETEIRTKVASHSKKHNSSMNVKAKRRNFIAKRTTDRRASISSVESGRVTKQMQDIKYKAGRRTNNKRKEFANDLDHRSQLQISNHNHPLATQDDDKQSNDERTMCRIAYTNEQPSNILEPFDGRHKTDDISCNQESYKMMQMLNTLLRENGGQQQLEKLLQSSYDRAEGVNLEKNARGSTKSKQNQRYSQTKLQQQQQQQQMQQQVPLGQDETTSSSSTDIDELPNGSNSSFSDQSIDRIKTQSQNSKGSCDVGIQANPYDISSHNRRERSRDDCHKDILSETTYQTSYNRDDDQFAETRQLFPSIRRDAPTIFSRKDATYMSELERKLLIPDKKPVIVHK